MWLQTTPIKGRFDRLIDPTKRRRNLRFNMFCCFFSEKIDEVRYKGVVANYT